VVRVQGGFARAFAQAVAVALLTAVGLLVYASLAGAGTGEAGEPGAERDVQADPGRELPGLRTATSRTFELPSGERAAKIYPTAVNFEDEGGDWLPIDNELVSEGAGERFALRNAANDYTARLPQSLAGAVRFEHDGHWAELTLEGAAGQADADGPKVTYGDAFPGIAAVLTATNGGLKEDLVLSDASARTEFRYRLATSDGLTAREDESGGAVLVDRDGKRRLTLAAPFMTDAAGAESTAVTLDVESGEQGQALVVSADRDWVAAPEREFPVTIDPTWVAGTEEDCGIAGASSASSNFCSHGVDRVGFDGTKAHRALMEFDIEYVVPRDSQITEAALAVEIASKTGATPVDVAAHRLTSSWDDGVTWNRRDGSTAWTAAGGDYDPQVEDTDSFGQYGAPDYYIFEDLQRVAERWHEDPAANHGVLLKAVNEGATNNVFSITSPRSDPNAAPYLYVTYEPRVGAHRYYNVDSQKVTDRMSYGVNVASGNLMLSERDVSIAGTGIDLVLGRTYNSRAASSGDFGTKWQVGAGARLVETEDTDDVTVRLGSGAVAFFRKLSNGTFESPTGVDATLEAVGGGGWRLRMHQSSEVLEFDAHGMLTKHSDRNGNFIDYVYTGGEPDRLEEVVDTQGREIDVDHDGAGRIVEFEDPSGRTWEYDYDGDELVAYTNPDGETTNYEYGAESRMTRVTTPAGREVVFDYDWDERVNSITRVTNFSNDTGPTTEYNFDWPLAPTCPADQALTVRTDPRGNPTKYCSDDLLRVVKVVDALGNERATTYNSNSDPLTQTAPGSATTTMSYDGLNNLEGVDEPAGEQTGFEYNATGLPYLPSKQTSPQGTGSVFAYDTVGNTTTIGDSSSPASQVEASLEYNGQTGGVCPDDATTKPGTLRCAVDGKGNETLYGYDDAGNLTSVTPELPLGATTIVNDSLSRVDSVEDGKGQTRGYSYDLMDRVTEIDYGAGNTVTFDYDHDGNRFERVDSVHGTSTWTYDDLGRRVEDDLPSGDTDYSYDAGSNLRYLTDAGGTVEYRYDDLNRVKDLAEPGGSCSSPVSLCTTFGYTSRDQRERTTYPNGVEQTVTFDSSDKPTRITAVKAGGPPTTLTDFSYVYDEASPGTLKTKLRQSVTDKDGNTTTYGYDFLDRLTSAIERNSSSAVIDSRAYDYDLASNRTAQVVNGSTTSFAYNAANQLCWQVSGSSGAGCGSPPGGAVTYGYDANGNTTGASNGVDFDYNVRDQTTAFTPPGGSPVSFGYAGAGQTERTSVGGTTQQNTLLGLSREGTTSWTRDPGGTLISQRQSGGVRHYYLADGQGSVVGLTDSSGAVTRTYKYDPYGAQRATTGSTPNPFQYVGQYREASGGLYKMGARYYAPGLGRWSQQDPIDQAGDLREANRYVYVGADPVNLIDPSGAASIDGVLKEMLDIVAETNHSVRTLSYMTRSVGVLGVFLVGVEYEKGKYQRYKRCSLSYSLFKDTFTDTVC
jgi:RHS repeat-associated protein